MEISTEMLIMLFLLMISITLGHWLKKSGHKYLQEAGLTTLIGIIAGSLLKVLNMQIYVENLTKHFTELFLILLLPPIIFESGYNRADFLLLCKIYLINRNYSYYEILITVFYTFKLAVAHFQVEA